MSTFKRISITIIALAVLITLALRIPKVIKEESTTTILSDLKEDSEFVAAVYSPLTKKIVTNDSVSFFPGKIYIQGAVKLKHRFFIFSPYFERSSTGYKNITYQSGEISNKSKFVLQVERNGTVFQEMAFSEELGPRLDFYTLNDQIMNTQNRKFDVTNYEKLDTLKFYIKQAQIKPFKVLGAGKIVSDYNVHTITLAKEPIDSLLFIRNKK